MKRFWFIGLFLLLFQAACSGSLETITIENSETMPQADDFSPSDPKGQSTERELEIVTLLPRDGIPAIDNPVYVSADEADLQYDPDELVIGVNFEGDARAYSIPMLSSHEIVNDTVGGRKIAVTW